MAFPTVVIIGRPNVGKSLLFNRLLNRRCALVHNAPGMTLDFLREPLTLANGQPLWLTDTGGVAGETDEWTALAGKQMEHAAATADLFLLVVDSQNGRTRGDEELARRLQRQHIPWLLIVNKADGNDTVAAAADFYTITTDRIVVVSAKRGSGLEALRQRLETCFPAPDTIASQPEATSIAIAGRPNTGKSTFINRLLDEDRLAVSARPGTTRDTVSCRFDYGDQSFLLLDTAGMGRKHARTERDRLSVAATRRTLGAADCALLMIDLSQGITYQDKRIAALIEESGCALMVIANKADLIPAPERKKLLKTALELLPPRYHAPAFVTSAVAKRPPPIGKILSAAHQIATLAHQHLSTAAVNSALCDIVTAKAPAQKGNIRPKLRYAHQGGSRPPCIVIHGNAVDRIEMSYQRYLASAFTRKFALRGNQVKIIFRNDENPYAPKH